MKLITSEIKAGLCPEKLMNDSRLGAAEKFLFAALTLYALPDETGEEWELDLEECAKRWLPRSRHETESMLQQLEDFGYIEDLMTPKGGRVVFSFPDWVLGLLTNELPPVVATVQRSAPAEGYVEHVARKDAKCGKCKKKIKAGEKYFDKGIAGTPKNCPTCAGEGAEGKKDELPSEVTLYATDPEKAEKVAEEMKKLDLRHLGDGGKIEGEDPKAKSERLELPPLTPVITANMALRIVTRLHKHGNYNVSDADNFIDAVEKVDETIKEYLVELPGMLG